MKIVHISEVDSFKAAEHPRDFSWIKSVRPDLVVCTGLSGTLELGEPPLVGSHILYVPGPGDNREAFFGVFGRRYRIDRTGGRGYPYLDRAVTVGGAALLLLDTADGPPAEQQLLWIQSQLDDLVSQVERGVLLPRICLFSRIPLIRPGVTSITGRHEGSLPKPTSGEFYAADVLFSTAVRLAAVGGSLTIFSGFDDETSAGAVHTHGLQQYTVPSWSAVSAIRIVDIDLSGSLETTVMYNRAR